eukprot:c15302_g1_i1.p1 GENE.c15302_g1_i1~~c15302_g1_i1.p1  ORF type:complete len:389 (+),score=174.94 c15302_g1_i1:44-1210(+)
MSRLSSFFLAAVALVFVAALCEARNLPMKQHSSFRHSLTKHAKAVPQVPASLPKRESAHRAKHNVLPSSANFDLEEEDVDKMFDSLKPTKLAPLASSKDMDDVEDLFAEADKKENEELQTKMALERLDKKTEKKADKIETSKKTETEPEYAVRLEHQVKDLTEELNKMKHEIKEMEQTQYELSKKAAEPAMKAKATTALEPESEPKPQAANKDDDDERLPLIDDLADAATAKLTDWGLMPAASSNSDSKKETAKNTKDEESKGIVDTVMETLGLTSDTDDSPKVNSKRTAAQKQQQKLEAENDDNAVDSNDDKDDENKADDDNETAKTDSKKASTATKVKDAEEDKDADDDEKEVAHAAKDTEVQAKKDSKVASKKSNDDDDDAADDE